MLKINKRGGVAGSFLICLGVSAAAVAVLSLIMAAVAMASDDPTGKIGIFSLIAMLLAALASGIFTARFKADGGIGFSALVALAVVLIMLLINVIISGGKVSGGAFMNYGCYFGVYLLASLLGKKRSGHKRHKHH